ncbi:MAG: hypothetical protein V1884_01875 [Candidatus Omnitrophota bacterium]
MSIKNIGKKTINLAIILSFLLSPSLFLWAEDYPAGFLAPGYRDYILQKTQNGYYVDIFTRIDLRQKERVSKRNQVEEILGYSYQATPIAANGIVSAEYQQKYNIDDVKRVIIQTRQERNKVASANYASGYTYLPYSDGKIEYFKDGLAIRIENERVVDEFGNVSHKNTYNMQYSDKRLLTSYEASLKDILGNITKLSWSGTYTADSVFYGGPNTKANKNINGYTLKEIDSAGNVKATRWDALSYEGKLLCAFSQTIEDSVYGKASFTRSKITYAGNDPAQMTSYHEEGIGTDNLAYTLDRTDIAYNGKGQVAAYHEEITTTQVDGKQVKTKTDAQFKYLDLGNNFGPDVEPDPDRLLETIMTTTTENPDGSSRIDTANTTYHYNAAGQLTGTSGQGQFKGREAKWYEYKDVAGRILSRSVDKDGVVTYTYVDPDTKNTVTVSEDQVTATLKDGKEFKGVQTSEVQFENTFGRPMAKEGDYVTVYLDPADDGIIKIEHSTITYTNGLVNNLPRLLSSQEYTIASSPQIDSDNTREEIRDISTVYQYDNKGNLIDAQGAGAGSGWEYSGEKGWSGQYTSIITIEYEIVSGRALRKTYTENRTSAYENTSSEENIDNEEATENQVTRETIPISVNKDTEIKIEYQYNSYGVILSSIETATTETTVTSKRKQEDGTYKEETSTTSTVSTTKSNFRDGSLKAEFVEGTSVTNGSDGATSTSEFWTNYEYDDQGQLKSVSGGQDSEGNRGKDANDKELGTFTSNRVDNYIIKDGRALRLGSVTTGINNGVNGQKESDFTETLSYEYELKGDSWEVMKETSHSETKNVNESITTTDKITVYQRNEEGVIIGITQTATGKMETTGGSGGKQTYEMRNYVAEFVLDPDLGWYLKKEEWDWEKI